MNSSDEMIDALLEYITPGSYVLEPSAGQGDLALALDNHNCKVDCVELNKMNYEFIKVFEGHNFNKVYHGDFLIFASTFDEKYDFAVAVPPYKDNIDCEHIKAMYSVIKPGGKVVSFTLPYWVTGIFSIQQDFRKWLSDKNYTLKLFEDDSSYLSCPKMLLVIQK